MGTSSLYSGPKSTLLLPHDYLEGLEAETHDEATNAVGESGAVEDQNNDSYADGQKESHFWTDARRSMTHLAKSGAEYNRVKAVREYTKALGGHNNATRQASSARRATVGLIRLLSGSPSEIRSKIEGLGISFENKTVADVLFEIRDALAPVPSQLEESYVNKAMSDMVSAVLEDDEFNVEDIDVLFSKELLEKMTCELIKWYIYNKMIAQVTLGVLKIDDGISKIAKFEEDLKAFIDGIVRAVVPTILHSGVSSKDIESLVYDLYDITYQTMEGQV